MLFPLAYLMVRAGGAVGDELTTSVLQRQVLPWTLNSVVLVVAVGGTCLVLGVLTGWWVACTDLPMRGTVLVLAALPLATPSYVAAYGWTSTIVGLQGFWPTWWVLSAACVPYVTLPVAAACRRLDHGLIEVAQAAGSGPVRAWRQAVWPQIAPAASAGALLAALYALADFGTPALLRHQVLTLAIHRQYGSFVGRERAALLAVILVLGAVLLVALELRARGNGERWRTSAGAARPARPVRLGPWRWAALAVAVVPTVVGVAIPIVALFRRMALGTRSSLHWPTLVDATVATVTVALLGGLLALLLAAGVGVLAARYRSPFSQTIESVAFSAHALPGIVVGLSFVYFGLRTAPGLYQTLTLLVLAYGVLFMPKAVGAVRTSVAAVSPRLPEVARSLGRPPWRAALVTGRLAAPGVLVGLCLVVVTAMKELPATLMLRPTGMDTLAVEMWSRTSSAAQGAAAPYALALVLVASVPSFLLTRRSTWAD
ncbi:ABC transporter permease [Nocardioides massiliensis]|uniref:Iron(III) transport system permease protein n=1 Tax=Nocardioides massiliensis TaxID=1325935 RepID=A0ABT9NNQ7_9ACTN|nr:ABC transporter permease subunit [Nocardioides massiliensis]MDP9822053.1 iron(III) transport system permease protein [Nocardioides massiliensis]